MHTTVFIWLIYASWAVLVVYLIVAAKGAKRDTQDHLLQSLGLAVAILAAFLLPHLAMFQFVNFAPVNAVASTIGVIVTAAGIAFFVWGRQQLGRNWSQTVSAKEGHELVATGPYRHVRHPMYAGGIVACVGSAIVAGGAFVFLLIFLTPIFIWRAGAEDRLLARQFPNEFAAYKARTKALIPFVW
jgi:protein-S-isoprenylcysteine O-methyltransferase Ste14